MEVLAWPLGVSQEKKTTTILLATSSFSHSYEAKVMNVFTIIKFWMPRSCINSRTAWKLNAIHLQGGCNIVLAHLCVFSSLGKHILYTINIKKAHSTHFTHEYINVQNHKNNGELLCTNMTRRFDNHSRVSVRLFLDTAELWATC